jgi:hypothetical protein
MSTSVVLRCDLCKEIVAEAGSYDEALQIAKPKGAEKFQNAKGLESHACDTCAARLVEARR